jgi:chemotaxis protein methyltransferase CheR
VVASEAARRLVEALVSWTGIDLERGGRRAAVDRFLENRTRALGVSATAYVDSLDGPDHPEVKELVEAFTVGHTWFYRDPEQLELISRLIETELHDQQPVQVWVPGCATGEDVYTLAMLAARSGWRGSFLGTDINAGFVERARAGRYSAWTLRNLPPEIRAHLHDGGGGQFEVARQVRSMVRFGCHNLLDPAAPSPTGAWNIILCRNVLIYFRPAQTLAAIEQLGRALASNGWLFLGASDAISTTLPGVRQIALEGRSALRRLSARPKGAASTEQSAARPKGVAVARPSFERDRQSGRSIDRRAEAPCPTVCTLPPPAAPAGEVPADRQKARDAWLTRGVAALEAGQTQGALLDLIKAIEVDPLCGEAHLFAGIAYHLSGDAPSAVQALRAAILLEPDLWLASFYLALNYEKAGQKTEAAREFRNVARALAQPTAMRRETLLSDKLAVWENDIAALARSRAR